MSENEQGTFKPQFGAELNIESIIGAPLVAASKANVMMLTGQAQFLLDYCFTKEEGSNLRQPLMIEMVLSHRLLIIRNNPLIRDTSLSTKWLFRFLYCAYCP